MSGTGDTHFNEGQQLLGPELVCPHSKVPWLVRGRWENPHEQDGELAVQLWADILHSIWGANFSSPLSMMYELEPQGKNAEWLGARHCPPIKL